jgi:hypothetical protein
MASLFPRDNLTSGFRRSASGKILVNLDESAVYDADVTNDDQSTRGIVRDADGAVLLEVTGLPGSVASADDVGAAQADADAALAALPAKPAAVFDGNGLLTALNVVTS